MAGVIHRAQDEIGAIMLEDVYRARLLPQLPEAVVPQAKHAQEDDPVDDRVPHQDNLIAGVSLGTFGDKPHCPIS
jgi:hypothetical protein